MKRASVRALAALAAAVFAVSAAGRLPAQRVPVEPFRPPRVEPFRPPRVEPIPVESFRPPSVNVPIKTLPSVSLPEGVRLPIRLPSDPVAEARLPWSGRINGSQERLRFNAAELNWEGFRAEVPKLRPADMPACAGRHLDDLNFHSENLRSLGDFRQQLNAEWPAKVSPEEFEGWLLALANGTPEGEIAQVRQYVALRAQLEGRPDIAKRLLGGKELPEGRAVLRDLKALGGAGGLPPPPKVSALDGLPLPEPEPRGFASSVKEPLGEGLPEFEKEATAAEAPARKRVLETVERSAWRHANHVEIVLYNLHGVTKALAPHDNEQEQRDRDKEVETHLGRRLTPAERLLARHLLRTMSPQEVAAKLRALDQAGN